LEPSGFQRMAENLKVGDLVTYSINFSGLTNYIGPGIVLEVAQLRSADYFVDQVLVYWFKHKKREHISRHHLDKIEGFK